MVESRRKVGTVFLNNKRELEATVVLAFSAWIRDVLGKVVVNDRSRIAEAVSQSSEKHLTRMKGSAN